MKKYPQFYTYRSICLGATLLLAGCAKFEEMSFHADKSELTKAQELLNDFDNLPSYKSSNAPYLLSSTVSYETFNQRGLYYRLFKRNFEEVSLPENDITHLSLVQEDGSLILGSVNTFLASIEDTELTWFGPPLIWHKNQRGDYLRDIVADIVIPGDSGEDIVASFEAEDIGSIITVMGSGSATVTTDPDGESGNVVKILGPQTFPQLTVTLPEGRTLGDYRTVAIDFKGAGCCGLYGGGMRMAITTSTGSIQLGPNNNFGSPSSFGIPDNNNQWARQRIILPLANLNLSSAQKNLTTFVLTLGSATGSADYLIDNVTMSWETAGQIIVKTPEEKSEIIQEEMEKYIGGLIEVAKDKVQAWSIVHEPISDSDPYEVRNSSALDPIPDDEYYWNDVLGNNYAVKAVQLARQYGNSTDKLFFTETNLLGNPQKLFALTNYITSIEGNGVTVDGIGTSLELTINSNREHITELLTALAQTGKLIRLSVDIGLGITRAQATPENYQAQEAFYKFLVRSYLDIIPIEQQYGMNFRSPIDRGESSSWRPNDPLGLWTEFDGYLRKPAYRGVVEALQNQ